MRRKKSVEKEVKKVLVKLDKDIVSYLILFLMMFSYSVVLTITSINYLNRFWFSAFDVGIFDQAVWLLSQGETPFVTVRGLNIFGDHVQFIILLLVPFYWIWNNIRMLLIIQSVALALGAIPIYLLAKDKFKNRWLPLIFVFSYLTYPALQFLNLENFHPVSLAVPFLLFAFYFLTKKKYHLYFLFVFLILITRQELALTLLVLGIFAFFKYNRKIGVLTVIASIVWLYLVFNLFFPYFAPFGNPNIRGRGGNLSKVITDMISSPIKVLELNTEQNRKYMLDLFLPVGFIPFLHLSTLFLSLPALAINILTPWSYAHSIEYHYTYAIIPFVFISAIYGISSLNDFIKKKKFKHRTKIFIFVLALISIASILGNIYIGPSTTSFKNYDQILRTMKTFNEFSPREKIIHEAIDSIPRDASVSAAYLIVPHMSHRKIIYMFSNPFQEKYWGAELGNFTPTPPTKDTDYIIVDDTINEFERSNIIDYFIEKGVYEKIFDKEKIVVLKRNRNVEFIGIRQ